METNQTYTFWNLINEFSIEIPIIQRDYAQGREGEVIQEIRENFLNTLFDMIKNKNDSVDLDFVYGSIIDNTDILTPLDGQQRLTTLFLLHWYLAVKDNNNIKDITKVLKKFTYKTRVSSRMFCEGLVTHDVQLPENVTLSEEIINAPWFFLSWQKDPTVKSMLNMLDAIHDKFKHTNGFFQRLTDENNKPIAFQFLKLNNFGLTDELYIKMNARGKPLTEFEYFKARFEQYLEKDNNLQKEFSKKIDGIWTDFFWSHRENYLIDKSFMRFFYFITEMLYYLDNEESLKYFNDEAKINFNIIKSVYGDENNKNIKFLFNSLDILNDMDINNSFFDKLFSRNNFENNKVALFDNRINLFNRCIKNDTFGIYEKVILFTIISYTIKYKKSEPSNNLKDLIRVIRNQLLRVRQQNQTKYNSNLRYENISRYIKIVINYIEDNENIYEVLNKNVELKSISSIDYEVGKAKLIKSSSALKETVYKLEDETLLQGSIHNMPLSLDFNNSQNYLTAFKEIWSLNNDSLIVRALLTIDDHSIETGWSNLGKKWYFGNNAGWHTILTNVKSKEMLLDIFTRFFDRYILSMKMTTAEKLADMINSWLLDTQVKDWRYYFIKYEEITSSEYNLFTYKSLGEDVDTNFRLRNLSKDSLRAWHINPYVKTVAQKINNKSICDINDCWSKTSEESPLVLKVCKIWCMEDGWRVYENHDYTLDSNVVQNFSLSKVVDKENIEYYLLKDNENRDRIEIVMDFISNV